MALIIKNYSEDGRPLCHFCKKRIGIHAMVMSKDFVPVCHPCYIEMNKPITKKELKDVIKEAIKEYASQKS